MAKRRMSLDEFEPAAPSVRIVEDDRPSSQAAKPAGSDKVAEQEPADLLKLKSFRLPAAMVKRLAVLKAETGRTEQELAAEAFDLLFSKLES